MDDLGNTAKQSVPLACELAAIPAEERPDHLALMDKLFGGTVEEVQPLPDGYRFRFPPEALDSLARFVANERRCCPFLAFAIEVSPANGPVFLQLTGPEGTGEFLEAELPLNRRARG
jgi:hypothetical protein